MMVIIDFGTSRTAVAIADETNWSWQKFGRPKIEAGGNKNSSPGEVLERFKNSGWQAMATLIAGVVHIEYKEDPRIPHVISYSSHCKIDDLVVPVHITGTRGAIQFPAGCDPQPPLEPHGGEFVSVKERQDLAGQFLGALSEMVHALAPKEPGKWIIGETCRSVLRTQKEWEVPTGQLRFTRYNEAAAVVFALASGMANVLDDIQTFVVLADLGGGFLDICVADKVVREEKSGSAEIVNYGAYPIGVDRVGMRFSEEAISNPDDLIRLIVTVIAYHIGDYYKKRGCDAHSAGMVCLTGGGFKRIEKADKNMTENISNQLARVVGNVIGAKMPLKVQVVNEDTKYLTIAGLATMAKLMAETEIKPEDDISNKDPRFHGNRILQHQNIELGSHALSWWGLLDAELRKYPQRG